MSDSGVVGEQLTVNACFERNDQPFRLADEPVRRDAGGGATYVATTADHQGPLAGLFAWGDSVEDAAHRLAELVCVTLMSGRLSRERVGLDKQTLTHHDLAEIHIRATTVQRYLVTSASRKDLALQIPYQMVCGSDVFYAIVSEEAMGFAGISGVGSTRKAAIGDLARHMRTKIITGDYAHLIPPTWPGHLALCHSRSLTFSVAALTRASGVA